MFLLERVTENLNTVKLLKEVKFMTLDITVTLARISAT